MALKGNNRKPEHVSDDKFITSTETVEQNRNTMSSDDKFITKTVETRTAIRPTIKRFANA
jgi:hypothetical protein